MEGVGCVCEAFVWVCVLGCRGVYICNEKILCESSAVAFRCIVYVNIDFTSGVITSKPSKNSTVAYRDYMQNIELVLPINPSTQSTDTPPSSPPKS